MKQYFLPIGLLMAIFFALLLPNFGEVLHNHNGINILIGIIFLVSGYQAGIKIAAPKKNLFKTLLTAATISLLLSPLLGLLITKALPLSQSLALGFLITAAVPPTLSSGIVITETSRGNTTLALILTICLNLLGIVTLPFMLNFCLTTTGPVTINQNALLLKMLVIVLLPFILGGLVRIIRKKKAVSSRWTYLNSSCIILVVYNSLAVSSNTFAEPGLDDYTLILTGVVLLHGLLLLINFKAGQFLTLPKPDRKALLFVASQKTLPISIAVLANLGQDSGNAVIVCLIFHFFQLMLDSLLAVIMAKRTPC